MVPARSRKTTQIYVKNVALIFCRLEWLRYFPSSTASLVGMQRRKKQRSAVKRRPCTHASIKKRFAGCRADGTPTKKKRPPRFRPRASNNSAAPLRLSFRRSNGGPRRNWGQEIPVALPLSRIDSSSRTAGVKNQKHHQGVHEVPYAARRVTGKKKRSLIRAARTTATLTRAFRSQPSTCAA